MQSTSPCACSRLLFKQHNNYVKVWKAGARELLFAKCLLSNSNLHAEIRLLPKQKNSGHARTIYWDNRPLHVMTGNFISSNGGHAGSNFD